VIRAISGTSGSDLIIEISRLSEPLDQFFIEQEELVKKILTHVGLWDVKKKRPTPKVHSPPEIAHLHMV
jgi:hypothetical protein